MKKLIFISIAATCYFLASIQVIRAQAPWAFSYQAVARNASGYIISNQLVSIRLSVRNLTEAGTVLYSEKQTVLTNQYGTFSVNIGQGTVLSGSISGIDWGIGNKYLQVEMDASGGETFVQMGTRQLLSVPFALSSASGGGFKVIGTNIIQENTSSFLGLGTTSPEYKLDISGRMRLKTSTLNDISNTPGIHFDDYRNGTNRVFLGMQDSIRMGWQLSGMNTAFWGMNINARSGNVNIGSSSGDNYRLQINGKDEAIGLYNSTNSFFGEINSVNGDLNINSSFGRLLFSGITGQKHILLNIPSNSSIGSITNVPGNVGIYTTSPTHAKLEINGKVGSTVAMFGGDDYGISMITNNKSEIGFNTFHETDYKTIKNGYGALMGMERMNGDFYFGNFNSQQSSENYSSITGFQKCMTIKQNGNIGIGTTNPTYKLSVNGSIRTKEVVVESGWADFVFDKNYLLPNLKEVENYIASHNHLPGIPSAKEIKDNGLSIGQTQTLMMQKIEELTLYIIKMEKKITEMENNLAELNKH